MQVSDAVLQQRQAAVAAKGKQAWQPEQRQRQISRALQAYAATTTSAARGAVRDLEQLS
jgi:dihydroxy-acid dehydratase